MRHALVASALGACGAGMALDGGGARAQAAPAAQPAAAAYVDRVLDEGPQAATLDEPQTQASGWPRGWSAEAQTTTQSSDGIATRSQSLLLSGHLDTPNHGALSVNANLIRDPAPVSGFGWLGTTGMPATRVPFSYQTGSTWRIDQRAMPFDGGWFGHASVGHIQLASTPLARHVGRVFLPGLPIEGASASIERPGKTSFHASAGQLGASFQGLSPSRGTAASAGAQTRLTGGDEALALGRTEAAVQFIEARDVEANGVPGHARATRSVWTAASWQGLAPWAEAVGSGFGGLGEKIGGLRLQANLVQSSGQPADAGSLARHDSAAGGWVDASWRTERTQQSAAVFHFQPSLRWGSESLPSDLRGASWRGDMATRQWQLGTSVEWSDSLSGLQDRSVFGHAFGRWRFDSRDSISGTLAARTGDFAAQSAEATWEHQSDLGYTQWRNEAARGADWRVVRSGIDHAWHVGETQTLSTSLAFERSNTDVRARRTVLWGLLGTTPLGAGARLDLSVRGSHGIGDSPERFLSASARVTWPLGRGWSLMTQYSASQGQAALDPAVVSALTAATLQPVWLTPSNRSFLLALRYEARAGLASAPIGGPPGVGWGRLEGHVFFDPNNNGRRDASEGGVGDATVMLNGRFIARTDAQGFYSFPSVAPGEPRIELVQDSLPLPWRSPGSPTQRAAIFVRDTTTLDLPIERER